jgi:CDP-paratose 2-epimerase
MRVLITGICGFAGATIAKWLVEHIESVSIFGIDNLMRPGSETNRADLKRAGATVIHGDIRNPSDFEMLPKVDWVIEAAANPSVLAGVNSSGTSRQLFEHNLASVANTLEYCKAQGAGLLLLSTSRVCSITALTNLPLEAGDDAFRLDCSKPLPRGVSAQGINGDFSTEAPISLYGSTKLAAEAVALEYGIAFDFPVWINRCGVLAGAGQFGTPDQGIFSYWVNAHLRRRPMRYIGFGGTGRQVRDAFHPRDLAELLYRQMKTSRRDGPRIYTVEAAQLTPCRWRNSPTGAIQDSESISPSQTTVHESTTSRGSSWIRRMPPAILTGDAARACRRYWRNLPRTPNSIPNG